MYLLGLSVPLRFLVCGVGLHASYLRIGCGSIYGFMNVNLKCSLQALSPFAQNPFPQTLIVAKPHIAVTNFFPSRLGGRTDLLSATHSLHLGILALEVPE